jgi:hypothetical protein
MMWGWLKPLLDALLAFLEKRANTPKTITDANTPQSIRDRWASSLRERLRDKGGSSGL